MLFSNSEFYSIMYKIFEIKVEKQQKFIKEKYKNLDTDKLSME